MKLRTSKSNLPELIPALCALGLAFMGLTSGSFWALTIGSLVGVPTLWLAFWGGEFLVVDVPRAMAHYQAVVKELNISVPLAELGELHIEVVKDRGNQSHAFKIDTYLLRAASMPKVKLYDTLKRPEAEARKTLIESLVAAAAVRPLLSISHGDGTAFRSGPDLLPRVREVVPDMTRLRAALAALTSDPDATVRSNAVVLRNALDGA
jgi:hypothetical protein